MASAQENDSDYTSASAPQSAYGPLSLIPTDARLARSENDHDVIDRLSERRPSRRPLMHPSWYTRAGPDEKLDSVKKVPEINSNGGSDKKICSSKRPSQADLPHLSITFNRHKYYSRLADPSDNRLQIPDHVVPSSLFYVIPTSSADKQNSIVTIFAIWNTMMGTSLLSMPWGLGQAGFTLGVLLILFFGCLTLYTAFRVLQSKDFIDIEVFEFPDVCKFYLGRFGEGIAVLFSLVTFLGGMMVYWVLMSNFLHTTGVFIRDKVVPNNVTFTNASSHEVVCAAVVPSPSVPNNTGQANQIQFGDEATDAFSRAWSLDRTVPVYLAIIVFPLLNFKSPTVFTKFNCLGTFSVVFLLSFVITKAVKWGWNFEFHFAPDPTGYYLPEFRPTFPALTGMLSLAYFIHSAIITIIKTNRHPENNVRDLSLAYLLVAATYLAVGITFYGSFPLAKSCIASNLLDNISSSDSLAAGARIFLLFQMITVFPLLAYMTRVNTLYAIFQTAWPGRMHVIVVNIIVLIICILIAMFYPHIGDIIRYSGATCGLVYIFFLPSIVYMLAKKRQGKLTVLDIIVHSIIIVLGILNFIAQFIIKPSA